MDVRSLVRVWWACAALLIGCQQAAKDGDDGVALGGGGSGTESGGGGTVSAGGAGTTPTAGSGGGSTANAGDAGAAGSAAAGAGGASGTDNAGGGSGAAGAGGTAGSSTPLPMGPASGPFPPVTDFMVDGPYTARTLEGVGPNSNYTVYLPTELAPGGAKNPIVGWMSGGATSHTGYPLLPRLATLGFVVVASNTIPGIGDEAALGQEIIAGIDWALAENERADSELFGKLDATKIASMGYSMGSLATFQIANDPRLTTTVHISGGNMAPEAIENLHAPAAFICGIPGDDTCNILSGDCDIAAANCDLDFMGATTPVFYANFQGGHLGILTPPLSDAIGAMASAWLRYELMSDSTLEPMFVGPDCTYCKDSAWKVQQKMLP